MVSNNVWIEATVAPKYADDLELGWVGATPAAKMHITLAFTTLAADQLDLHYLLQLRDRLDKVNREAGSIAAVSPNGVGFLNTNDTAVMLVTGEAVWNLREAYAQVLKADGTLDTTYPGFLPHITLAEGMTNYGDIEAVHRKVREYPHDVIYVDGVYLRAGRITLPL